MARNKKIIATASILLLVVLAVVGAYFVRKNLLELAMSDAVAAADSATLLPAQAGTQRITRHPQGQPVIALWNDGVYIAKLKPFLLFAAWEDGTVLRRADVRKPMGSGIFDWAAEKLTIGVVKPADVLTLQAAIAKAEFFRPPLMYGLLFADGPSQSLCVRYGKAHRLLSHYGPSDKWLREAIEKMGPTSFPTREDEEAFAAMWDKVTELIDAVTPTNTSEFRDQLKLTRPEPFEATDENGNPSVAYWGIPEHKEEKANKGTPRSVTTMTTVQVVEREKYLELKRAGKVRNEERHGDWLYFATSGDVQIPNDTGYMEVITRYKALVPTSQPERLPVPKTSSGREKDDTVEEAPRKAGAKE